MSDKRSVATDALETLGTAPLDDTAKRDAIHLAVLPAIAGVLLRAGDHVTVADGSAYLTSVGKGIGIVDPFIQVLVKPGERFWLVMYPRTITSLRHVWSHPAFPDEATAVATLGAVSQSKAESERWLRDWCDNNDAPGYESLIRYINEHDGENSLFVGNRESSAEIPDELWNHVEIVLGRKISQRPTYFSCSC